MIRYFILIIAVLALCNTVRAQKFVAGFLPNIPAGYELASFSDITSNEFVTQYNTVGISFVAPFTVPVCCAVSVQEGFLTFAGNVGGYLENFQGSNDCCTSGFMPHNTTLGIPPFASGPFSGVWLKQLHQKEVSMLGYNATAPPMSFAECTAATSNSSIFKKTGTPTPPPTTPAPTTPPPQYIVAPYGPNYLAPAGYQKMGLSDFTSTSFMNSYNTKGLRLVGNYTFNYCCMLQLNDNGWLTYGAENNFSPFSLFVGGTWACGSQAMGGLVTIGASFGGPYDNIVFPTLNATMMQMVGELYNNTRKNFDDCLAFPDSLTMWMLN